MDVVDVAQPKEAGEEAAGEHPRRQVQADGQALADDTAAPWPHRINQGSTAQISSVWWVLPEVHSHGVGTQEGVVHGAQQLLVVALI